LSRRPATRADFLIAWWRAPLRRRLLKRARNRHPTGADKRRPPSRSAHRQRLVGKPRKRPAVGITNPASRDVQDSANGACDDTGARVALLRRVSLSNRIPEPLIPNGETLPERA